MNENEKSVSSLIMDYETAVSTAKELQSRSDATRDAAAQIQRQIADRLGLVVPGSTKTTAKKYPSSGRFYISAEKLAQFKSALNGTPVNAGTVASAIGAPKKSTSVYLAKLVQMGHARRTGRGEYVAA